MERLIDDKSREGLKTYFADILQREVDVNIYTDRNSEMSEFVVQFSNELSELSSKVKVNVYELNKGKKYGITTDPFIVIGENLGYKMIFNGTPAGHEANTFIELIKMASIGSSGLTDETKKGLKDIKDTTKIQVFVTPSCPYCPYAAIISGAFAIENPNILLEVVEAQENIPLAQKFNVSSVPLVVINEDMNKLLVGVQPEDKLLALISGKEIKNNELELPDNPDGVVYLNDGNFNEALKKYEKLVVDFWADWCMPCKMLAPIIDSLSGELRGRVVFAKLNTDENPIVSAEYNVESIPTLLLFQNGKQINRLVGARSKEQLYSEVSSTFKLISLA
ncbi:MAG: thioredoxin [Brevinematales bacterium]|nr:thioredoxin [Brevinematales bacterium]